LIAPFQVAFEEVLKVDVVPVSGMVTESWADRTAKCAESSPTAQSPQDLWTPLPDASALAAKMVAGSN
jgi:hypothetical protein